MRKIIFCLIFIFAASFVDAEIIELRNGNILEGKIISQNDGEFKVLTEAGDSETYYLYEIKNINGKEMVVSDLVENGM